MFAKVIYCLLLSFFMVNTSLAVEGQKIFFTPEPVNFPANLNEQALNEYTGQLLDFNKKGIYCLTTKHVYDDKRNTATPTLFLAPCSYSIIITLNDLELYRWGDFKNPVSMTNFGASAIVLSNIKNGENYLKLYFYSDGKSMPLPHFYIDDYANVAKSSSIQTLFNLYLIQAIGIVALFSALLFFGYSAASKFKEHDILYFSFFALSIFMGYGHFIMNSPTSDDLLWFKISRIGYALAAFLLFLFSCEYTKLTKKYWVRWVRGVFSLTLILAIFMFSESANQKILNERFSLFSILHILPLLFMGYFTLILNASEKRKKAIILIIGGYSLFLMGTIHDIAFVLLGREPYFWVTPYGYFMIIITIIYSLIIRYYHNIKRREETEALLRESEKFRKQIYESSRIPIIVMDAKSFRYIDCNAATVRLYGFTTKEDVIGKTPLEFSAAFQYDGTPSEEKSINYIKTAKKNGSVVFEWKHQRNDGQTWDAEVHLLSFEIGNRKLMQFSLIDITNRKRAEEKLLKSEEKYRLLMESSPDPIVVYDMEGKVVYLNPAFTKVFGWTFKELHGMMIDYVPDEQRPKTNKMLEKMIRGEKYQGFETQRFTKSGDIIDISMSFDIWRDQNGDRTGSIVTLQDVTEHKKTQQIMIQTEKMMSVGGLAAGMAHEINNPLAGVIQNANVLANRLTDKTIPANISTAESVGTSMETIYKFMEARKIPRMTKAIIDSGQRMASIVDNMLSFARKSDSASSTHDPIELFDKVLELASTDFDLKKHYDFKSIHIEKIYENNLPLITCEGGKIQQVLLNILKNGAYEMFANSNISNPKFTIRLQHEMASHMLKIEIEDNGPGMDKQTCKRIFEPFFTTKPEGIGTGLGLSVSYFIVTENHNGEMMVLSEPGKGSNFIIRLPLDGNTQ